MQLALLQLLAMACTGPPEDTDIAHNRAACLRSEAVKGGLRACVASRDAFVYSAVIFILRALGMPLPPFRGLRAAESRQAASRRHPETWSIGQVVAWAGQRPFGVYRSVFRTGMVSGKVLLSLTDQELAENGVEHSLHRKAILFAIQELKQEAEHAAGGTSSGGGSGGGIGQPHGPLGAGAPAFDVFISYRRAGGEDFAHLLKQCLSVGGREVFLDVENIGTGNFADTLDRSLRASRNVVLVWSKGCLDRFLDGKDPQNMDFVRREYALALALQKNIVPVAKDDFVRDARSTSRGRHCCCPSPLPCHCPRHSSLPRALFP
jgi:hypothetical protein